jgi:two-component system NtrC family sensor kinase
LVLVSVYADEGYLSPSARLPADTGISGWVLKHEEPLLLGNVVEDDRYWTPPDLEIPTTLRAVVAVPLLSQGEAIGVLWVGSAEADRYTREDLHTLQALASSLSIAVQNAQLYQDLRALLRERERTQAHMIHTEKMAALGRLVASLAHEINNPLQAVQGCLTLGREELGDIEIRSEDAEALAYYLNIAEDEIERISGIVRRMRDFYRPAREGMKPTNVHDVLGGIIALTNKQLQHSNVDIEREWQEDLPEVLGNADHLKQVFLNLVLNAIDAMPEGGTLTIRTGPGRMPAGEGLPDTATVRIDFKDTGSGIPKEVLSRIFEPFFTTKEHGSGLGLSISYNIIRSHNGDIIVTSEEGDGTTFTILLPVKEEPKQTSASVRRGGQHEP